MFCCPTVTLDDVEYLDLHHGQYLSLIPPHQYAFRELVNGFRNGAMYLDAGSVMVVMPLLMGLPRGNSKFSFTFRSR